MWWFFHKPWIKDPVIKQPGFNGKLEFFFCGSNRFVIHTHLSQWKKIWSKNVIPCPNRKWESYWWKFEYILAVKPWGMYVKPRESGKPEVRKDYFLSSSRGTWSRKRGTLPCMKMGVSKNMEYPQIIHSNKGFPLFSPSILGVFPLIFGNTQMQGLDHYDGYPIHLWPQGIGDFFFVDGWLQWMVHLQLEWEWHMTGWWGKWFFEPPKNQVGVYHVNKICCYVVATRRFFMFTPIFWGNDPLWLAHIFSDGVGSTTN